MRHRRNQGLRPETPEAEERRPSLAGLTVIGLVANPKTKEPALVVTDGEFVSLRSLGQKDLLRRIGRGYYEESKNDPAFATDLPRSHTPDGVSPKGKGWGTSLYTALALGAHLTSEDVIKIDMWRAGDGICSETDSRSNEADVWWGQAVRLGLAEKHVEEESEKEEDVDLDLTPSDLDRFVDEGEVVYVNSVNVDIEKTKELVVETYPYDHATDRHLIAAELNIEVPAGLPLENSLGFLRKQVGEMAELIIEADPIALMALDVRELDRAAVYILSLLYEYADLGEDARDELMLRYESKLDPEAKVGQGRLFTPNGMAEVETAREEAGWRDLESLT